MKYADLVEIYKELEATSATLEKTEILASTFESAELDHLPMLVTLMLGKVFANWESKELGVSTSLLKAAITKATGIDDDTLENWWRDEGDLGNAAAKATSERRQRTLFNEQLTVRRVFETIQQVAEYEGEGSQDQRIDAIAGLLSDADPEEARYIARTITGAMRVGVGEGLICDAIAWAFIGRSDEAIEAVERAYEVTNDFRVVARRAATNGAPGVMELDIEVFRPIKPMLAGKAEGMSDAFTALGDQDGVVLLETKYDGIRAKIHRQDETIRMFTRRLEDVTEQFPDVIEEVRTAISAQEYIVEAEVVGFDPETGDPVPFQQLSQRIKRKYDIDRVASEVPVATHLFDCLYVNGESLLEEPLRSRIQHLEAILSADSETIGRASNARTADISRMESFYEEALTAGHEGIMVKNLDAAYQPGSRVGTQLKIKPTMEPLDLIVTRAKWSEGRKSDFLGRPYLACRDTTDGSLKEVGRMHTGFTDEELKEFTALVEPLIQRVEGREATFDPQIVLEVEYEEIQESTKYDSGYALRFPRLRQIRMDLGPDDIDTLDFVNQQYQGQ